MKSILSVKQKSDKSVEDLMMIAEEDYSNKSGQGSTGKGSCDAGSESLLFNDDNTVARFGSAVTVTVDSSISFSLSDPFMPREEDETDGGEVEEEDDAGSVHSRHSRSSTSSSGRHSRQGTHLHFVICICDAKVKSQRRISFA